jgi:hypothetical protein
MNRVSALKILNKFAQDMGQTLCECFIVPEVKSLGLDEVSHVRIAVAKNLINISWQLNRPIFFGAAAITSTGSASNRGFVLSGVLVFFVAMASLHCSHWA